MNGTCVASELRSIRLMATGGQSKAFPKGIRIFAGLFHGLTEYLGQVGSKICAISPVLLIKPHQHSQKIAWVVITFKQGVGAKPLDRELQDQGQRDFLANCETNLVSGEVFERLAAES